MHKDEIDKIAAVAGTFDITQIEEEKPEQRITHS